MFQPAKTNLRESIFKTHGAHYNIYACIPGKEMEVIKTAGEPDEENFWLFSTSGVHGTYVTIEEIERGLNENDPDSGTELTFLFMNPRTVTITYGTVDLTKEDIPLFKRLRQKSWDAVQKIGK